MLTWCHAERRAGRPNGAAAGPTAYHRRVGDLLIVLIVVLLVVLIWRGPKTLPKLGEALGRGIREARHQASREPDPDEPTAAPPADGDRRA